ncbi:hypothetical protein O0I10_008429 [Lichtheimia ornata]|uniref:Integrator complex subunit 3 n=1 Tax=Lichtheimia ornata TaxID=688661 RepID=A0AAD7UYL2_9FUNG|nr:uncharacterized protein O0I10_008429 [Lichtheimia ornata]KAJ8655989.1 hypothetical protein O0I10_008429 [Lichtheimia ornata]
MEADISNLYDLDEIEAVDELDKELSAHYTQYCQSISDKSELEIHNILQQKASQSRRDYTEIVSALLYGALTEPENAQTHFNSLTLVNRDQFGIVINRIHILASNTRFHLLKPRTRDQMLWLINELTTLDVQAIENIYLSLLRQIRSGDMSSNNTNFSYQLLRLCEHHRRWLHLHPRIIAIAVYTYLRQIPDHRTGQLSQLQQREIKFVTSLMREKWMACCVIGRDLVRLLQDVSSIPEFQQLWHDLLNEPQKLSPMFKGITTLLQTPTPREYLRCRLTPDMEHKLLFILQNLRNGHYQRNLGWFMQRYLLTAESFYVDVIRYIVAGWYPSNQILQSDIVPRYVVIGSLLRAIKNPVVAANVKIALIYDWLFFKENDNIMFIEPSMLLMERSAERYPYITAIMMEFLKHAVDEYYPPLKDYMEKCVACGMRVMLEKGVIRSLMPIYNCSLTEKSTRDCMQALFSPFLTSKESTSANNNASSLPQMPPAASISSPILQSPSMSSSSSNTPTSQRPIPDTTTIKTEEEQQQPSINENQNGAMEGLIQGDDDVVVARYPYGENDTMEKEKTPPPSDHQPAAGEPMVIEQGDQDAQVMEGVSTAEDIPQPVIVTTSKVMDSSQSYMMFGDSIVRFQSACSSLVSGLEDEEEKQLQMTIAKRSLREVLDVYLRMSLSGEALASSMAEQIYQISDMTLLEHAFTITSDNLDDVIVDSSQDLMDVLMTTLWSAHKKEDTSARTKMMDLLSALTKSINNNNRHLVGMRWWSFFASRLSQQQEANTWIASMIDLYRILVSKGYGMADAGLSECLTLDMQLLAEVNTQYTFDILPLLYEYMPAYTIGNVELIKLLAAMIVPDQLGNMVSFIQAGKIQCFGESINTSFLVSSFAMETYETITIWELLSAELRGRQERIEEFLNSPETINLFHTQNLNEIMPQLLSLLATAQPTSLLVETCLQLIPSSSHIEQRKINIQLVISALSYWYRIDTTNSHIQQAIETLSNMTRNDPDESIRQFTESITRITS